MEISYTIFDLLFYLLLYAFLGWCVEVFCAAVKSGRFVNRGFLNLPLNMPCGIAAALLLARRRLEGSAGASEGTKKEREVTPP